jgi:UDP-N-acetylmuramate dehydrogenase
MKTSKNVPLAPYESLKVGGPAEVLIESDSYEEVTGVLSDLNPSMPFHLLGFGSNSLISDKGLPGTTLQWRGGAITHQDVSIIADAGAWWDDVVLYALKQGLWGLELMSEIPSSVGGGVFGNIAAYGQQISDTLEWIEVYDRRTKSVQRLPKTAFSFGYRESSLQTSSHLIILRVGFRLSRTPLHTLRYESALKVARELNLTLGALEDIRSIIVETRRRAGSLYRYDNPSAQRTAGSFFKNPLVSIEQAKLLASQDETGASLERILEQSRIHGGSTKRVSAAHVLLAAGFKRGQQWDNVRLHPDHVLKIETLPGATAQEVYDVAGDIMRSVNERLQIVLTPEVRFLGSFS